MKKKQSQKQMKIDSTVSSVVNAYREGGEETDPMGMYTGNVTMTGNPIQPTAAVAGGKTYQALSDAVPVQDADDL